MCYGCIELAGDLVHTAAWSGETNEPSYPGYQSPTTPYIARGMNVSLPTDDHDLFHAINEHRATPEHMQRLVTNGGKSGAGIWWGTYSHPDAPDKHAYGNFDDFADHAGEGANPQESVANYHDSGEYQDRVNDAGGKQGPNQIFAETPVVMVGKRPQRGNAQWDPEIHNPPNGLMGNSYLDDDEPVELHEIHYHSGRDWVKVPMPQGTTVRTAKANFPYLRNNGGMRDVEGFGQEHEPWGRYMSPDNDEHHLPLQKGWERGNATFENPLYVPHNYGAWKQELSDANGGLTGHDLSDALLAKGHDGVITHDKYGLGEIVDIRPKEQRGYQPLGGSG